ncbi:MAG: exonuclease [Planctomycetaceae bacterium]|nr:MAG: exonuclease [Planctomycetaceae bacterium]
MLALEQGTPEWKMGRCGKATGSRINDVVAKIRNGQPSASRATYMGEIVAEQLTGIPTEHYVSTPMQFGTETEAEARAAYAFERLTVVKKVGLVVHPTIKMSAASPDGYVGEDGLIEIKCPNTATHIETLRGRSVPGKYACQMQWGMACSGRRWCDFVSYDPRMPKHMRLYIFRVVRDNKRIAELEAEVQAFLHEVDAQVAELTRLYPAREEAA